MFNDLNKLPTDLARHLQFKSQISVYPGCSPPGVFNMTSPFTPCGETHINVLQGKNHRVINEYTAGLFVDGGRDDVRVHDHWHVAAVSLVGHLDGGVFGTEELTQVFVEHKNQLGDSCREREADRWRKLRRKKKFRKNVGNVWIRKERWRNRGLYLF